MVKFKRRKFFRTLSLLALSTFAARTVSAKPKGTILLPADLGVLTKHYFLGDESFYIFRAILKVIVPPFSVFAEYEKVVFVNTENIIIASESALLPLPLLPMIATKSPLKGRFVSNHRSCRIEVSFLITLVDLHLNLTHFCI